MWHSGWPGALLPCRSIPAGLAVLVGHVRRGRDQVVQHTQVRAGVVGGQLHRRGPVRECSGEEPAGCRGVPLFGQEDVDDLPVLVNRPVEVPPPAGDLDLRLVDEPRVPGGVPTRAGGIREQRHEPLHPPVHGDVVDLDPALGEQLLEIPVGRRVAQVPVERNRDHLRRELEPGNADRSMLGRAARRRRIHPACPRARSATPATLDGRNRARSAGRRRAMQAGNSSSPTK